MAKLISCEQSTIVINLDQVQHFKPDDPGTKNPAIKFYFTGEGANIVVWRFETNEQRDAIYNQIIDGGTGRLFASKESLTVASWKLYLLHSWYLFMKRKLLYLAEEALSACLGLFLVWAFFFKGGDLQDTIMVTWIVSSVLILGIIGVRYIKRVAGWG